MVFRLALSLQIKIIENADFRGKAFEFLFYQLILFFINKHKPSLGGESSIITFFINVNIWLLNFLESEQTLYSYHKIKQVLGS